MVDVVPDDASRSSTTSTRPRASARSHGCASSATAVAHHAVWPHVDLDDRFDPVVAWHNPDPEYMQMEVRRGRQRDGAAVLRSEHYRSDSNQHWRHGCPHEELRSTAFEWLQLLTHPEIWAYDGATMGETMESMLDADRAARLEHSGTTGSISREADHGHGHAAARPAPRRCCGRCARTASASAPRRHGHERALGRPHLCDAFHLVPGGADPGFPGRDARDREREGVDAILPQSSFDLEGLAAHATASRCRCSSRAPTRSTARTTRPRRTSSCTGSACRRRSSAGSTARTRSRRRRTSSATRSAPVCFKPVFSSGSRGFRILDPTVDRAHQLLNERPGVGAMRLEEAVELLPTRAAPDLLVMELATGGERTIDGIADGSEIVLGHPKTREAMRAGLAMYFVTLEDEELMRAANLIVAELGIEHFFNIQLVGEHVIEINPRISTIVYQEDLNLPYLGVKRALGEISDDELRTLRVAHPPGPDRAALLRPARVRRMSSSLGQAAARPVPSPNDPSSGCRKALAASRRVHSPHDDVTEV
jgi:hypothetical protein